MWKAMRLCLIFSVVLGACSTTPCKFACVYDLDMEKWLEAYEAGHLAKEQCLVLVRGRFEVQKTTAVKIVVSRQADGMSSLARETRKKLDARISEDI